ncbi:MAG: hypothetical protein QOK02_6188 [Mycobacterium sp.]|nr:hypothetical protein [Mycobacterium sp.]
MATRAEAGCQDRGVVDGRTTPPRAADAAVTRASIDALIDRAVSAINGGDRRAAAALAGEILATDDDNADAEDLLAASAEAGEIRRLTLLVADLIDSTALSTRVDPETYHSVVGRFRDRVQRIIASHEGHVGSTAGDGVFAVFGHPIAHVDDARRAVRAGLDICAEVDRISERARRRYGIEIAVRVGVHRGLVYLDVGQDDVYGLAANLAARVSGLAPPGGVVVSASVESLIRNDFELEQRPNAPVKGVTDPVEHYQVRTERAVPLRAASGPLVGREGERAMIHDRWQRLRTGSSTATGVLVLGEAGIGKSRLTADAALLVAASGAVVVELNGSREHSGVGLHPIRQLLAQRCDIRHGCDPREQLRRLGVEVAACGLDPATMVPALAPILAIDPDQGYERLTAEGRTLVKLIGAAVETYLVASLGGRPGLVIADDLHWFDGSTMDVLASLLTGDHRGLMLLMTSRGTNPRPEWPVEVISLGKLSDAHTDQLITALHPQVDDEQRAQVRRRCDGVPFHIEQIAASLNASVADLGGVPDALYEPLFARIHTDREVVPVVEAAAAIGREIDRELLLAITGLDEHVIEQIMDRLVAAGAIEQAGARDWRFRHELLREVAGELAPSTVRRSLHGKVADALVRQSDEPDWPLVAGHLEHAARPADAAKAYRRASAAARRRGALAEARAHLTQALDHVEHAPPGPDRDRIEIGARLERGYLTATAEGAQSDVAVADFERCLELTGTDLHDDELVAALGAVGAYYCWRADLRRVRQVLDVVAAGGVERQWFSVAIQASRGLVEWLSGDFATATACFTEAIADLPADYDRRLENVWLITHDPIAMAHEHLAWNHLVGGDISSAEGQLAQAVQRSEHLSYPQGPYNHLYAIDMEIWIHAELCRFDQARALVDDMLELSRRYGLDDGFWQLLAATERATIDGLAEVASDHPDRGVLASQIEALSGIITVWQALGAATNRPFYWCVLARLLIADGQIEAARARIDTALQFAADTGVSFYSAELLRARAHTQRDSEAQLADFISAGDLARTQGAWLFELRAARDAFDLHGESARSRLEDVLSTPAADGRIAEIERARAAVGGA